MLRIISLRLNRVRAVQTTVRRHQSGYRASDPSPRDEPGLRFGIKTESPGNGSSSRQAWGDRSEESSSQVQRKPPRILTNDSGAVSIEGSDLPGPYRERRTGARSMQGDSSTGRERSSATRPEYLSDRDSTQGSRYNTRRDDRRTGDSPRKGGFGLARTDDGMPPRIESSYLGGTRSNRNGSREAQSGRDSSRPRQSREGTESDLKSPEIIPDRLMFPTSNYGLRTSSQTETKADSRRTPRITPVAGVQLDDFFAGHAAPDVVTVHEPEKPRGWQETATHAAPFPLAQYTPPRESGVEIVKKLLIEHKFLSTQDIWQLATGHLKPKIAPSQVVNPDGTIKMKRVATMREGRRIWIPPPGQRYPDHPFQSVRFLKEILLASLERNGAIHKSAVHKPLETEEEFAEAILEAERVNRKNARRAELKGLPIPPVRAPATAKLAYGWIAGPPPPWKAARDEAIERAKQKAEWEKRNKYAKQRTEEIAKYSEEEENLGLEAEGYSGYGVSAAAQGLREAEEMRFREERELGIMHDPFPTFGSTSPEAKQADEYRNLMAQSQRREEYEMIDGPSRHDDESPNESASMEQYSEQSEGSEQYEHKHSAQARKAGTWPTYEEVKNADVYLDERVWEWCAQQEYQYHKAKFIAAQEIAERQYVRRTRYREEKMARRRDKEERIVPQTIDLFNKEKRREEAVNDIKEYAALTGQDVSHWLTEIEDGDVGLVEEYQPVHQARGGVVPRRPGKRSSFKPMGFPVN